MIKTLRKYEEKADSEKWREENLTSYDMTIIVKSYYTVLEQIYEKYAGITQKNLNTKTKKKMLLEEYKMMMLQAELRKTKEGLKDLEIAFRTAKELETEDGIQDTGLDFIEFMETFCRFSEKIFLVPLGTESHPLWEREVVKAEDIPLFLKVEKLMKDIILAPLSDRDAVMVAKSEINGLMLVRRRIKSLLDDGELAKHQQELESQQETDE